MAKAKRTPAHSEQPDDPKQPPATSPAEAAALIARVIPKAVDLFGQTVSPKVHSYPAGMALPDGLAEKARLRIYAWEEMRAIRIRENPFYLREIDASAWRLAARAQAVAPLLADANLDYHNLLEMAWKLEKAGQAAQPTDWPGALHDFEAARPALEEGKVYYEAAARKATAAQAQEMAAPKAPPPAKQGKPKLSTEQRQQVNVGGKWHDVTVEGWRLLSTLFTAKGAWVSGKTLGGRPDKIIDKMPAAVRRIIKGKKPEGYRIPSLLPK